MVTLVKTEHNEGFLCEEETFMCRRGVFRPQRLSELIATLNYLYMSKLLLQFAFHVYRDVFRIHTCSLQR